MNTLKSPFSRHHGRKTIFSPRKFLPIRVCLLCVLLLLLGGCRPRGVAVSTVTGTVRYDGSPVRGAVVSFVPKSPGGRGASAQTDSEGKFIAMTQGAKISGVVPGDYLVTISKITEVDENGQPVVRTRQEFRPNAPPEKRYPVKNLLPGQYASKNKTPLSASVVQANNHFDFTLEDE